MIASHPVVADWLRTLGRTADSFAEQGDASREPAPVSEEFEGNPSRDSQQSEGQSGTPLPKLPTELPTPRIRSSVPLLSIERSAMACEFEVLLNRGEHEHSADHAMAALDLVQRVEMELSVYKPRSELSTINRYGAKRPIPVLPDTMQLLALAKALFELTDGAFDVTAGRLSEAWGFSRRDGRMPGQAAIDAALQRVGSEKLKLDRASSMVSLTQDGVQVNSGGIGKGFALDLAASQLKQAGVASFMMHGGASSIVAAGDRCHPSTGGGWRVAVKHPWRPEHVLGTIRLRDEALGTSGSGKQFFHFGGQRYSHIIDPRTGWPAQSMMAATVVCSSGAVADALATALFVMGPEAARAFCEKHTDIKAVLVYQPKKSTMTQVEPLNFSSESWLPEAG